MNFWLEKLGLKRKAAPTRFKINNDDYHAKEVGRTMDGRQFFLTEPFVPSADGQEFIALYLFDSEGAFIEADIVEAGKRPNVVLEKAEATKTEMLAKLGQRVHCPICIEPFQVEKFGQLFGLIPRLEDADGKEWWVEAHPGNYMAFHSPWDSGEYDT